MHPKTRTYCSFLQNSYWDLFSNIKNHLFLNFAFQLNCMYFGTVLLQGLDSRRLPWIRFPVTVCPSQIHFMIGLTIKTSQLYVLFSSKHIWKLVFLEGYNRHSQQDTGPRPDGTHKIREYGCQLLHLWWKLTVSGGIIMWDIIMETVSINLHRPNTFEVGRAPMQIPPKAAATGICDPQRYVCVLPNALSDFGDYSCMFPRK